MAIRSKQIQKSMWASNIIHIKVTFSFIIQSLCKQKKHIQSSILSTVLAVNCVAIFYTHLRFITVSQYLVPLPVITGKKKALNYKATKTVLPQSVWVQTDVICLLFFFKKRSHKLSYKYYNHLILQIKIQTLFKINPHIRLFLKSSDNGHTKTNQGLSFV